MRKYSTYWIAILVLIVLSCGQKPTTIPVFSTDFIQLSGRHTTEADRSIRFSAAAFIVECKVQSKEVSFEFSKVSDLDWRYNWFSVREDGKEIKRFRTEPGKLNYTITLLNSTKPVSVQLIHETEGLQGYVRLKQITARQFFPKEKKSPKKRVEFIGDSITSGFGNYSDEIPCGKGQWFDKHSASRSYAFLLSEQLQFDALLTSASGIGVTRHWRDTEPVMKTAYPSVFVDPNYKDSVWTFSQKADLVVIALGTNDFSDGDGKTPRGVLEKNYFVSEYVNLIELVLKHQPEVTSFLLTDSPMLRDSKKERLNEWLKEIAAVASSKFGIHVQTFTYDGYFSSGCDAHPSEEEHQEMAKQLKTTLIELL